MIRKKTSLLRFSFSSYCDFFLFSRFQTVFLKQQQQNESVTKVQDIAAINGRRIRVPSKLDKSQYRETHGRRDLGAVPQKKVQRMIIPNVELIMQRSGEGHADHVRDEEHGNDLILREIYLLRIFEKLHNSSSAGKKRRRRPSEMGEEEERGDVREEKKKLKVAVEEQPLGNATPIHRPFIKELSRELKGAQNVAARILDQERGADEELQRGAEEDEEEKTAPTHLVEQH